MNRAFVIATMLFITLLAPGQADSSSHRVQFVTFEQGVKLEILDWGGSGQPLVLLAGNENLANNSARKAVRLAADKARCSAQADGVPSTRVF